MTLGANVVDINNFARCKYTKYLAVLLHKEQTVHLYKKVTMVLIVPSDNCRRSGTYYSSAFSIITPSQAVLDDVAIVSGAITYSEDLGLITNAASTGSSRWVTRHVADA